MGSHKDLGKPVSGEVITRDDDRMPVVGGIFSRVSRFVFRNMWERKKVASVREVIREERGLWEDLADHNKSFNRFRNIDRILREDDAMFEANAIAAENRLAEEKRKEAARKRDDLIFQHNKAFEEMQSGMRNEYELKIQEAEYKKKLHALQKELANLEAKESAQPKKTRGPSTADIFKEKDKIDKEYAKRKTTIESGKGSAAEKKTSMNLLDGWREEMLERAEKQFRKGVDKDEA